VGDGRKYLVDGIGCDYLVNVQMLSLDGESAVQAHLSSATYRYDAVAILFLSLARLIESWFIRVSSLNKLQSLSLSQPLWIDDG